MNAISRRPLLPVALLLVLLGGCSDLFSSGYEYGRVVVSATDPSGAPVPGVELTLYTGLRHMAYGVTDQDGLYAFRFVPAGSYGVDTRPPEGYTYPPGTTAYQYVDVRRGETQSLEFVYDPDPVASAGRGPRAPPAGWR